MVIIRGVITLLLIGLWLYCVLDVITTDSSLVRNMPKLVWLVVVILLPTVGSLLWLIAGRPRRTVQAAPPRAARPLNPDDDEEFLRRLRQRAEEQRRAGREKADPESPDTSKPEPAPED
ncbi:membrane protein [Acrocarpospora corrugata]|uniref:Membrane protein n=1 Tax=Acrocarpospora corrugata TaxID=35763 RepID=A0A5M3W7F8_9ACTN|nr:PLDc N-terminal domain-containing protein [Acrocarpospora corrugata]GES03091.1 membrane protein [Acrocarpospora corrugata]